MLRWDLRSQLHGWEPDKYYDEELLRGWSDATPNLKACVLETPAPLGNMDINGGYHDGDLATLVPGAWIPTWVCLMEVSRGEGPSKRYCGWDVCTEMLQARTEAFEAFDRECLRSSAHPMLAHKVFIPNPKPKTLNLNPIPKP